VCYTVMLTGVAAVQHVCYTVMLTGIADVLRI